MRAPSCRCRHQTLRFSNGVSIWCLIFEGILQAERAPFSKQSSPPPASMLARRANGSMMTSSRFLTMYSGPRKSSLFERVMETAMLRRGGSHGDSVTVVSSGHMAHAIIMMLAWVVIAPIAVALATRTRYGSRVTTRYFQQGDDGAWWFALHRNSC